MSEHHKDYTGAKLGMWFFLFTELMLFGGLFILYAVYLKRYPKEFVTAGDQLSVVLGTTNTLVLLTSSFFVAMSITALQRGEKKFALRLIGGTIAFAGVFLIIKYFEWTAKFHHGIYPGSPHIKEIAPGESIFFSLYFITTGLHGIHVIIGALVLAWAMLGVKTGKVNSKDWILLENAGLYWHLVDLIWIYVFALYYLVL
ncbi:MAG TPA: cytochrome c oxidase subunit 3 family protein [Candidatus Brocadiaceae bacterium]|nr:cytochrome c oxidase subunit 3 family protein [Candidatus Brocadiaceae bacterium]